MDTVTIDTRLSQPAKEFLHQPSRLLIDGKLVEAASGKTFPVYNPATGAILMQVPEADNADVDRAVKAARNTLRCPSLRFLLDDQSGLAQLLDDPVVVAALDHSRACPVVRRT